MEILESLSLEFTAYFQPIPNHVKRISLFPDSHYVFCVSLDVMNISRSPSIRSHPTDPFIILEATLAPRSCIFYLKKNGPSVVYVSSNWCPVEQTMLFWRTSSAYMHD